MIKVIELFAGVGSQHAALERLKNDYGFHYEVIGISEFDKYAVKSYEAIHGPVENYGDITRIVKLPKADFWTYSFPCQDISIAGNQKGIKEGTRSGLLYDVERLLEVSHACDELPQYLMLENVKNLSGHKFIKTFTNWIKTLDEMGYITYWNILNAKDYTIPQNRERLFALSIRKDIKKKYTFPEAIKINQSLKSILEKEPNESFFIKNEISEEFIKRIIDTPAVNNRIKMLGMLNIKGNEQIRRVYDINGISPTLNTMQGGNRQPKILVNGRIRKLTPRECWRLMGFTDEEFEKAEKVNSNSQLYKQAGNSIVVDVLYHIFKNLFISGGNYDN